MELPPELERAIANAPDDREGYAVAADWLQQAGSPQGELAALSLAEANDEIVDRIIELKHQLLPPDVRTLSPTTLEWRWGFVRGINVSGIDDTSTPRILRDLLVSPIARFVQKLVLENATERLLNAILDARAIEPRALSCTRTVFVMRNHLQPLDVSLLSTALPSVRRMHLWVRRTSGALVQPQLFELGLYSNAAATELCRNSTMPALESLFVSRTELQSPDHWLEPARLPAMRALSLSVEEPVDRGSWLRANIAAQLEQLDVFNVERGTETTRLLVIDRRPFHRRCGLLSMVRYRNVEPGVLFPIEERLRIGRSKDSHLRLDAKELRQNHAAVEVLRGRWHARTIGDRRFYLNEHSMTGATLRDNDELSFDGFVFRFIEAHDLEAAAAKVRARHGI